MARRKCPETKKPCDAGCPPWSDRAYCHKRVIKDRARAREEYAKAEAALEVVKLEECSKAAHEAWMAEKARRGVTTWPNEHGVEQMVHWDQLGEDVREFDRVVVGAILQVMRDKSMLP